MTRQRTDGHAGAQRPLVVDARTSARLGKIPQRNTGPELTVRRLLHRFGCRFRTENRDLPGAPDLANRRRRWVVFVHGCFWHGHAGCPRATVPKRNRAFWMAKFETNRERDRRVVRELRRMSFRALTIWECELERPARLERRLRQWVGQICGNRDS